MTASTSWIPYLTARIIPVLILCCLGSARAGTTEEIIQCYKTYSSTYFCDTFGNCSMKVKLGPISHQLAQRCVRETLRCRLEAEAGKSGINCLSRANNRCGNALHHREELENGWFVQQRAQVTADCANLAFADDVLAVDGMGFAANEQACTALGAPLQSIDDLVACSDAWLRCEIEKVIALVTPRANEALTAADWDGSFAPSGCMQPALPGNTTGMDYKNLHRCESRIQKFGQRFVRGSLVAIEDCIDQLLICKLEGQSDCAGELFCRRRIQKIDSLQSKFELKALKKCGEQSMSDLETGLGLAQPGHACEGASSPSELIQCLSAELRCFFDRIVGFLKPRATELLTDHDLIGHFACMP